MDYRFIITNSTKVMYRIDKLKNEINIIYIIIKI